MTFHRQSLYALAFLLCTGLGGSIPQGRKTPVVTQQEQKAPQKQTPQNKLQTSMMPYSASRLVQVSSMATVELGPAYNHLRLPTYRGPDGGFVYPPVYSVKRDNKGQPEIYKHQEGNKTVLSLTVIRGAPDLGAQVARQLSEAGYPAIPQRCSPADVAELRIEDVTPDISEEHRFTPWTGRNVLNGEYALSLRIDHKSAEAIYKRIVTHGRFVLRTTQRIAVEKILQTTSASVLFDDIQNIKLLQELAGKTIGGDLEKLKSPHVTRKQKLKIEQVLRKHLRAHIRVPQGSKHYRQALSVIDRMMKSLMKQATISANDDAAFARLKAESGASARLGDPIIIQQFMKDVQSSHEREDNTNSSSETGGGGGFLGFSVSASVKKKYARHWKDIQKHKYKVQMSPIQVPVGIELNRMDWSALKRHIDVSFVVDDVSYGMQEFTFEFGTRSVSNWEILRTAIEQAAPDQAAALAQPRTKIDKEQAAVKGSAAVLNLDLKLNRKELFEIGQLPKTGDSGQVDRQAIFVATIVLRTRSGYQDSHQLVFRGTRNGLVGSYKSSVDFLLLDDRLYAYLTGSKGKR